MHSSLVYRPSSWLDQFFNDFDKGVTTQANTFHPAIDIVEEKESFVLRAELPGIPKENIKIEVKDSRLFLSGKKESVTENHSGEYRYVESRSGSFSRAFELPRTVTGEEIQAEYNHGVLTLRIPKAREALSKTIEIK